MPEVLTDDNNYCYIEVADDFKITRAVTVFEFDDSLSTEYKFEKDGTQITVDVSGTDEQEKFILFVANNILALQNFGYTDGFENTELFSKDDDGFLSRYGFNGLMISYKEETGFKISHENNSILMPDDEDFIFKFLEALFILKSN